MAQEDPTMAVTNLTQAIKIQPTNADIYMRRARLYQERDQVLVYSYKISSGFLAKEN